MIGIIASGAGCLLYHTLKYALNWNTFRRNQHHTIEILSRTHQPFMIPATPPIPTLKAISDNGKKETGNKVDDAIFDSIKYPDVIIEEKKDLLVDAQAADIITNEASTPDPENTSHIILEEDNPATFPESTSANDQTPTSHDSSLQASPITDSPPQQLTPLEEIVQTCRTVWNHASHHEKDCVKNIFEALIQEVNFSIEASGNKVTNSAHFVLDFLNKIHWQ